MKLLTHSTFMFFFQTSTVSQFPGLYDALTGSKSIFRGIKNVVGGILTIDEKHHGCIKKQICCEFADDQCKGVHEEPDNALDEEGSGDGDDYDYDPVKRSWVRKPKRRKFIKERGRLRWIGDAIANGLSRVAKGVGFVPSSNRRQGLPPTLMNKAADFALSHWEKIPWHEMIQ